jgi:uncharacterized protein YdeI (YjbR/CyaY-like superfamily)
MGTPTQPLDGAEMILFADVAEWESWLAEHYELPAGVWLLIAKKGSGQTSVTITQALDVALCYGWIDSQRRSHDEHFYLQRYSPRRPKGSWSRVNVDKVAALMAAGRMRAPGLAEVAAAKADGRWDAAYESQKEAGTPPDLAAALAGDEQAAAAFAQLGRTARYAVILRLLKARTPATRAARLAKTITQLAAGRPVR